MRLSLVAALLVAVSAPVIAAPEQANEGAPKAVKEKKVCKLDEQGSTSRMRKRICRTVKEWDQAAENKVEASDLPRMDAN